MVVFACMPSEEDAVTLVVLLSGAPVVFALGGLALAFLIIFQGFDAIHVAAETFYAARRDGR